MTDPNARFAAIETLVRLFRTRHPVTRILSEVTASCGLDQSDRQLTMNIVYGVLRHRQQLEALIEQRCSRPISDQHPWILQTLAVGFYQLFFLDRIPDFAAVSETVSATRQAGLPKRLSGFVNGVLRNSLRCSKEITELLDQQSGTDRCLNHPSWMTRRWRDHFGEPVMREICAHNNREPVLCLRVAKAIGRSFFLERLADAGIPARAGKIAPDAVLLDNLRQPLETLPGFADGWFQVQDQTAQLATLLLAPFHPSRRYLDCCAGLGGKTAYLADLLPTDVVSVTAIEPDRTRFSLLEQNLSRTSGLARVERYPTTLEHFITTALRYDAVLLDAPCSGTGVIGRHPDIRWNRRHEDLATYRRRQLELLQAASQLLRPGGILVYATCSIEPEENTSVIDSFLSANPSFALTDCGMILPETARHLVTDSLFCPLPGPEQDGFFAARLQSAAGR